MMTGGSGWFNFMRGGDDKPSKITRELLLRVLGYARPYRWHLAGMLTLILCNAILSLISPLLYRHLIDDVLPSRSLDQLGGIALALFTLPLISGGLGIVQRRLNSTIGEGVIYDLRVSLFGKLQRMGMRFFTNTKIGELMSRLNSDVVGAQNAISNTITNIIINLVQTIAILAVMISMQWQLTLVSIIILPLFVLSARLLGTRMRDISRRAMDLNAEMNAHMNETLNIGGALLVKLFGRTSEEESRFRQRAGEVRNIGIERAMVGTTFFIIIGLVSSIGSAVVYGLGGYFVIQGNFTVGTVVAFGTYLGTLYGALQGLASAPVDFSTSMVSFERVFEVTDLPLDIIEKPDAVVLTDVKGLLEFDNVSFDYRSAATPTLSEVKRYGSMDNAKGVLSGQTAKQETPKSEPTESQAREVALSGISFQARPGQLVALVGPSGAGKTTTTYLIPRLYDPSDGAIRLDGHNLRDVTLESLATTIGMVTQENYLFHDTIHTNLTYARPDATPAEIEAAARAANIHSFISALPDGYNTVVGERGYRLSGGEKQRIALARVILKNPRILVLDEATSHLDSESEALIQEALKRVMAGRTSIVIAHRLSTILAADLILVMDRGRIVERGTHAELLALNGLYAQLYETQFQRS